MRKGLTPAQRRALQALDAHGVLRVWAPHPQRSAVLGAAVDIRTIRCLLAKGWIVPGPLRGTWVRTTPPC